MNTFKKYFWPCPPRKTSDLSKDQLKKSLKQARWGRFHDFTNDLDVWTKHEDDIARKENREWLKPHALTFAKRWGVLSAFTWSLGWLFSGFLFFEIPLVLFGFISGAVAMIFYYIHRDLN